MCIGYFCVCHILGNQVYCSGSRKERCGRRAQWHRRRWTRSDCAIKAGQFLYYGQERNASAMLLYHRGEEIAEDVAWCFKGIEVYQLELCKFF